MNYNVGVITKEAAELEPPSERLFSGSVREAAAIARRKADGKPRWVRAVDTAETYYNRTVFEDLPNGLVRVTSPNSGRKYYVAQNGKVCDCEAYEKRNIPCWHRAAVWLRKIMSRI